MRIYVYHISYMTPLKPAVTAAEHEDVISYGQGTTRFPKTRKEKETNISNIYKTVVSAYSK